ncbi:probable G-protein coupled receptor 158, partial [Lingula anatina]|uniref:Probable G-protein coupled receptor 158 n=1 Tax=Lingula anatina TaxID=7574 RepID=A0A1S3IIY5_LINAN
SDIDDCAEKPCKNDATCIDLVASYRCICLPGFTGKDCETNIDDCYSDPCVNDGNCTDLVLDYTCTCPSGYTGKNCETDIDDCAEKPCKNDASCTDLVASYRCICLPGFTGKDCETNIDDCNSDPCVNDGNCTDLVLDYTCTCPAGYTGKNCETDIDDCAEKPCKNDATCIDLVASYRCICLPGFTGKDCETNIDDCNSDPCVNDGNCTDLVLDYTCTCPAGYTGKNCETDIDDCAEKPCKNDATCIDLVASYRCICLPGFSGKDCEMSVNRLTEIQIRGVVAIHIDLQRHDINQCTAHGDFFSGTNRCQPETTKCIPIPGRGFSVGAYKCQCKKGYYFPNITANVSYFDGLEMERVYFSDLQKNKNSSFSEEFQCLPCKRGCDQCVDDSPCLVEYDFRLMRGIPLGIQSFCMTIVLIIGIVIIRIRKKKAIKVSMWIMLEIILFGALLMYTSVVVQYFEPTTLTCILVPWFREVGFAIVFGALILKIYRFLAEFQTRRARRVHIRDKDLLKYLLGLVIIVLGYMCAWTAANFQHEHDGSSLTEMGMIAEGTQFVVCKSHWWDYIIEVAEFLFLCCGIYLCYCIRSAPSLFAETRYISWAIYNETVISAILHVARHFLLTILHPDYMFLMYFLRCHLTVSVTLVLVFGPKLWYTHRPPKTDFRGRAFSDVDEITKLRMGLTLNGEVTDMNIAEMDPEEIKGELKRLYTQLQIFKTKSMRKDNPHISKRRGGRKPTHRRFSLQPFAHHHKHSRHRDHEHEYEMSRTPEESTNSAEGITIIVEDTTNGEHDEAQSTSHQAQCLQKESSPGPTVTFKPGTKRC